MKADNLADCLVVMLAGKMVEMTADEMVGWMGLMMAALLVVYLVGTMVDQSVEQWVEKTEHQMVAKKVE